MSMHGVDFAFNFFQPKGEKNKGELGEASVALRRVSPCLIIFDFYFLYDINN